MKLCIHFLLFFVLSNQLSANEKKTIRLGVVNYPPYYDFSDPKKPKGIVLGLISDFLGKTYILEWEEIPLSRAAEALNSNLIDIYLGFRKTAEREKLLSYSKKPYLQAQPHLCGNKKAIQILKKEDKLTGSIVIPSKAKVPKRLLEHETLAIDYSNYIQRGLSLLKSKRVSMVMVPEKFMTHIYLNNSEQVECTSFGDPVLMYLVFKKYNPLRFEIAELKVPNFTQLATKATEELLEKK
ncbi:MAG: transporter substrate-binding domain-containing protein [Bdellovibrionota bacterium]|nr:transporter substrate-binding domain-containing protein [Bdellovibrionota bacterium]